MSVANTIQQVHIELSCVQACSTPLACRPFLSSRRAGHDRQSLPLDLARKGSIFLGFVGRANATSRTRQVGSYPRICPRNRRQFVRTRSVARDVLDSPALHEDLSRSSTATQT